MDFTHTDERRMLQDSLSRYLQEQYPFTTRMSIAQSDSGVDLNKYRELCDLGIAGLLLDDSAGGYGGGGFDISVVFEELGRGLVVEPVLGSALLSGRLLSAAAPGALPEALLSGIISGDKIAALAHAEPASRYALAHVETEAHYHENTWIVNGQKSLVLNADVADVLLVSARTAGSASDEQGISVFMLDMQTPGVTVRAYPTIDGLRAAQVDLQNVSIGDESLVLEQQHGFAAIESTVAAAVVALCAEALGAMQVCEEMTIEYLQTRKQFGVLIGTFQALQHRLVDMSIEIEQARSAVINAAARLDADRNERERSVSAAKNLIGRVARQVAEESIQLHGGMAMTWEYPLSHFAKRLIMIDHMFGDSDHHLERFIRFSEV